MSGTPDDKEAALFAYMEGWKLGAKGALQSVRYANNFHLSSGFAAGREARMEAYRKACLIYGTELSPLRGESP